MNITKVSHIVLICVLKNSVYGDLMQMPIVSIEMDSVGFHRELQYSVQFDYPLAGKDCEYVLEQLLPAAVYISVDQLDDLRRLRKLNAIYAKFVDIEIQAEIANTLTILLKGTPKITDTIKLPIHFRYHAPSLESSSVTVVLNNPNMYMRCPDDDDLIDTELQATPTVNYCLNEEMITFTSSRSVNPQNIEDCDWKLIRANIRLKSPLNAKIPIGNEKSYPPILYATVVISWIVSLWTVFRTQSVPRRINQKLEEQRVLQNKVK